MQKGLVKVSTFSKPSFRAIGSIHDLASGLSNKPPHGKQAHNDGYEISV
ncbi:MAG: hypothetical protein ACI9OH_003878 [Oleispira sp.]|jgi:hypothetical protein